MRIALFAAASLVLACTTPLQRGERLYGESDRLGALETWRAVPENSSEWKPARERIAVVEAEFQQLVVRYKKRASHFERQERLGESILNYRLALELQPDDAPTLDRVQKLARSLAARMTSLQKQYRGVFEAGNLAEARRRLTHLRALDPFDPAIEAEERQLDEALRVEIERLMGAGRRGFVSADSAAAKSAFEAVLELEPDNESARGYLSYIETIGREQRGARSSPVGLGMTDRLATDAEIRAEGFYQNALAAERRGDPYAAIRHDQRAIAANSAHAEAARHLVLLRQRLTPRVEDLIEAGRAAFREEDLQAALDMWRLALLVDPENERARAYVVRARKQIQNLERLRAEPDVAGGGR